MLPEGTRVRRPVVKVRHSGRYHDRHRRLALRFHPLSDHGRRHRPLYQEIIKRDAGLYPLVEQRLRDCCAALGLQVAAWFDSPIDGGDGNHEFFLYARPVGEPNTRR